MGKKLCFVLIVFLFFHCQDNRRRTNLQLKGELDGIIYRDQEYRSILDQFYDPQQKIIFAEVYNIPVTDIEDYFWKLQLSLDSLNIIIIDSIVNTYSYPGKTIVGDQYNQSGIKTNEVAWYVI